MLKKMMENQIVMMENQLQMMRLLLENLPESEKQNDEPLFDAEGKCLHPTNMREKITGFGAAPGWYCKNCGYVEEG